MALAADLDLPTPPEALPLQNLVHRRVDLASSMIVDAAETGANVFVLTGIMKGGKTETTNAIKGKARRGFTTYKNFGFNRHGSTDETIYMNNGKMIAGNVQPVMGLGGVRERLLNGAHTAGEIISIEEAAFMGSPEDANCLVDVALQKGVSVVVDALGADFGMRKFSTTEAFMARADRTFIMTGWDVVDPSQQSETNLRVVGITQDYQVLHQDGAFYRNNPASINQAIAGLREAGLLERFVIRKPDQFPGIDWCYGIPSNPSDPMLAIGSDRYFPLSLANYRSVYQAASIADPNAFVSIHDLYPDIGNKFDWASVGLN